MKLFAKIVLVVSFMSAPVFAQNGNAGNGNSNSNGNGNVSGNGNGNTVNVDNKVGICAGCVSGLLTGGGGGGGGASFPDQGKKWHPPMVQKSGMASSN